MFKLYANTSTGQVHARVEESGGDETRPALVCLHPAPSSGLYFATAMPMLNEGRRVVAPDYPGYGSSDALAGTPAIEDYARAMLEFIDAAGIETPVDVLGFHTGCLVGSEMALQRPRVVRRLVLCDVPYFPADKRAGLLGKMGQPPGISAELASIEPAWRFNVAGRVDDVPLPRTIELLAEHLRAGFNEHLGFAAAFSYACEERLPELDVETTVIATQSTLREPSLAAAAAVPGAVLIEADEITAAVFESGASAIAMRINVALS
ncbi:MAG: alpha/beta hydrolase [Woeseiaceae bacterium]|nr:alpha/beta hydrolase [Woeseiaceae bacterium]